MMKTKKKAALKVGEFLPTLAREINVRLEKATQIEGKADDHRLAATLKLAEAKTRCEAQKVNFKKWCEANIKYSYENVRKLAAIGLSADPPKALADLRAGTKKAMKKSRAKARATASDPAAVADTAIATMPEADAAKFIERQARKHGVDAKRPSAGLEEVKLAFDALSADDKVKLLAYAAEKTGAEVKLFGEKVAANIEAAPATPAPRRRRKRVA